MPVKPLALRLDALPLVLAGPILRRVGPDQVTVWVALRKPRRVRLEVFRREATGAWAATPELTADAPTVRLGAALHVVAVTAKVATPKLQGDTVYGYQLTFDALAGEPSDTAPTGNLFKDGVIAKTQADAEKVLLYKHLANAPTLPSFILPTDDLNRLRMFHGSCRKMHGESTDALSILDDVIEDALKPGATASRPHLLLMGGDQIYADDVADALLWLLMDAAQTLLDGPEVIPGISADDLRPGRRAKTAERIKFTAMEKDKPQYAKSHLMQLGEYYAMYLFAWSDVLYPTVNYVTDTYFLEELPRYEEIYPPFPGSVPIGTMPQWAWPGRFKHYIDECRRLRLTQKTLPKVRRALANVPTYMVFDDHEVTDDWNLCLDWCGKVYDEGNAGGRRVVQNALLAYAVFQAWGNTPEQFVSAQPGFQLLEAAKGWFGGQAQADKDQRLKELLGVPLYRGGTRVAPPSTPVPMTWHYKVEGPRFEIIVLDTRTMRAFPGKPLDPPEMLSDEAFEKQLPKTPPPEDGITLVVTPTNAVSEWATELAVHHLSKESVYDPDAGDAWTGQSHGFELLLAKLANRAPDKGTPRRVARVVILTGDIHNSFAFRLQYWGEFPYKAEAGKPVDAVFAELTSSAFKNEIDKTRMLHEARVASLLPDRWLGWRFPLTPDNVRLTTVSNPLENPKYWRMQRTPSMLSLADIPPLSDINFPPHWRYRIDMVGDPRNLSQSSLNITHPDQEQTGEWWMNRLKEIAYDRAQAQVPFSLGRYVVGRNNIGEVRFVWGTGDDKYVSQLLWWLRTGETRAGPHTVLLVSLRINEGSRYPKPMYPGEAS